jgi:hypothetical protein
MLGNYLLLVINVHYTANIRLNGIVLQRRTILFTGTWTTLYSIGRDLESPPALIFTILV